MLIPTHLHNEIHANLLWIIFLLFLFYISLYILFNFLGNFVYIGYIILGFYFGIIKVALQNS